MPTRDEPPRKAQPENKPPGEEKAPASTEQQDGAKIKVKRGRRRLYQSVPESKPAAVVPKASPPAARKRSGKPPAKARGRTASAAPKREGAGKPAAGAEQGAASRATRVESARKLVRKYSLGTAAVGLVPLPLVDLVAFSLLQGRMLKRLAELYEVEYSEQRARIYSGALLGSVTSISVGRQTGVLVGSLLKSVPAVGQVAGAALMPAASGAGTYALGKVFISHFEAGGTLLDFDPEKMRGYYEQQVAEARDRAWASRRDAIG